MKNNHDEETYNSIQNLSKPNSTNRIGTNTDSFQRNHLFSDDKTQCSDLKENMFDNNKTKYLNKSRELTNCHNKLNRNMGEHFLLKDLGYSQSIKSFCFTNNTGINCITEDNILTSEENNKHYTHELLNNSGSTRLTIRDGFTNNNSNVNNNSISHMLTSNVTLYKDKTTYCRPVLSYYNQQYIYKTMERNAKLKNLVKKLSIARQREKEKVNWNNFINELKNKHRCGHDDALLEEYITPEIINNDDNTSFSLQKSGLCRNILQDFYGAYDTLQTNSIHGQRQHPPQNIQYLPCNTNSFCYPTSSIGRLIMLRRNQENHKYLKSQESHKICNCEEKADAYKSNSNKYKDINLKNFKSSLVQVDNKLISQFIENNTKNKSRSNREALFSNKSNERNTLDELNYTQLRNINNSSLVNIENKLECLIQAINSFMVQIKSRKRTAQDIKCKNVTNKIAEKINRKLNTTKSDSFGKRKKENKGLGEVSANSSGSTLSFLYGHPSDAFQSNINEVLREVETYNEVDFHNRLKNSLNKPCAVQISIEVPTKDCCTEVTKSLSKHKALNKVVTIDKIIPPERRLSKEKLLPIQRMTIAVNTDPLSFLTLLRFSTETLRRLISCMPNFDYLSYLSALSFLQTPRTTETSYICKICGAAFENPTKLSDHIHGHNLGKTRDCCVCRHVLERARASLFSCQYCGQHFTRAYCCELHQQSCAKQLGKRHNAASSLMLLR